MSSSSSTNVKYYSHPEDPSLMCVRSKNSRTTCVADLHLKQQSKIEKLSNQNENLREKLQKKEKELAELRDRNAILDHKLNTIDIERSSISSQKISELSKSNRNLNAHLNSMRNKLRESELKLAQLEREVFEKELALKEQKQREKMQEPPEPSEIHRLHEELDRTQKRFFDIKNQNCQLKNELKMAHKCLQQEVGSDVNFSQILNGTSNWRGRAQQISILQSKIAELKEKFESDYESFDSSPKNLDSIRRLEIDSLNKELDDCKNELEDLKQKVVALKTRNKNLGDDLNNYKLKTLELMEKSKNDDSYIESLNQKISMTKFECEHQINEMEKKIQQVEEIKSQSSLDVQKLNCEIDNLKEVMTEKDKEINKLKSERDELENNLKSVTGDFLFSCRDMSKENYVGLMETLENEKSQLINMMRDLNERCNRASLKENEQQEVIIKQRNKIARLEGKIREFENEAEARKAKHRRSIRINEYSRSTTNIARPMTQSKERLAAVDSLKLK